MQKLATVVAVAHQFIAKNLNHLVDQMVEMAVEVAMLF
jgi:hypothetical protein